MHQLTQFEIYIVPRQDNNHSSNNIDSVKHIDAIIFRKIKSNQCTSSPTYLVGLFSTSFISLFGFSRNIITSLTNTDVWNRSYQFRINVSNTHKPTKSWPLGKSKFLSRLKRPSHIVIGVTAVSIRNNLTRYHWFIFPWTLKDSSHSWKTL